MSINFINMNYYFKITLLLLLCSCKSVYNLTNRQRAYKTINETIYEITQTQKDSVIYLFENSVPINLRLDKNFFTYSYLKEIYGKGGVIGVDSNKINTLLNEIDLKIINLDNDAKVQKWDTSQFNFPYKILNENIKNSIPNHKQNNLSIPLFVEDSYFFIYTDYDCGFECGQGTIVIFKKVNGKWKEYERLPIWVS